MQKGRRDFLDGVITLVLDIYKGLYKGLPGKKKIIIVSGIKNCGFRSGTEKKK